jgi:hypothetical protein
MGSFEVFEELWVALEERGKRVGKKGVTHVVLYNQHSGQ